MYIGFWCHNIRGRQVCTSDAAKTSDVHTLCTSDKTTDAHLREVVGWKLQNIRCTYDMYI